MIGQGRPATSSRAPFARLFRATSWLCGVALMLIVAGGSTLQAAEISLRLRIAWGGGPDHIWRGSVTLSQGEFSQLRALGIEADEPGSIWLEGNQQIQIRPPSRARTTGWTCS